MYLLFCKKPKLKVKEVFFFFIFLYNKNRQGKHMKKLLTIAKDASIKVSSQITNYLEPTHIYIPINEEILQNIEIKKVKKGEKLYFYQGKDFYSSVSGRIVGILKNQEKKYLEIKNDYKEEDMYQGMNEFTTVSIKTNFKQKIKECPNFDIGKFKNKKILILNGIEDEPYVANRPFIHKLETSSILQMLDCLSEVFNIPEVRIYLKETDRESIEAFEEMIGTYPNISISILPDFYPIGNEKILREYVKLDENTSILSTEQIMDLYLNTIRERKKDVTFVTITGNAIKNPQVFRVKIGTIANELIQKCIEFKKTDYKIFLNGIMNRQEIDLESLVITEDVRAIYFMKPLKYQPKKCIHCGKCDEVCPRKSHPYLAVQTKGTYKNEECIGCGLCTFVCPSYIDVSKFLKKRREE